MHDADAPYHAHVYYAPDTRSRAAALRDSLATTMRNAPDSGLRFVGQLRDHKVGPHPVPQFEVHFMRSATDRLLPVLRQSALTVLVHPLTLDDLADHTTLAQWIGDPIALDLAPLDPPGVNQGIARFGKTDFQRASRLAIEARGRAAPELIVRQAKPRAAWRLGLTDHHLADLYDGGQVPCSSEYRP